MQWRNGGGGAEKKIKTDVEHVNKSICVKEKKTQHVKKKLIMQIEECGKGNS